MVTKSSTEPGAGADTLNPLLALGDAEFCWDAPEPEDVETSFSSDAHAATSNKAAAMLKIFMRIISPLSVGYVVIQYSFNAACR